MSLFDLPKTRSTRKQDTVIACKSVQKPSIPSVKGGGILDKIERIKVAVSKHLKQYESEFAYITDKEVLHDYITSCIDNGYVSIDTETSGLDPLRDTLAGTCLYTHEQKAIYIPTGHVSYITQQLISGQLDREFVMRELKRLLATKPEIDMFNAKFDIRVLRANGLPEIYCTWDGYLGARLLNENEPSNRLKPLWVKYCRDGQGEAVNFDDLFEGIPFTMVPYNIGYLYAAGDAIKTTELNSYQRKYLREDSPREDMRNIYWVFKNIEMPCVPVIADMEDNGILFDTDYASKLSVKYHALMEEKKQAFYKACELYKAKIDSYRASAKLDDPINIGSSTQLAVLLYDILGITPPDKKNPRGTDVGILEKIDNPIARIVLEYRGVQKLLSTYIDKLPECINPNDGKIHCSFHQYGASTGRMSSSDPNLQNIPSHNQEIRKMFTASPGYLLMSSDFSQQEPKCLAALCRKDGDSQMYDTFMDGKDLYSEIASKSFNKPYEQCREFNPDGTTNKEGKERRTQAKSILLGVLYGRGVPSIAEQLYGTPKNKLEAKKFNQKAQAIKDSVFRGFPAIKKFEQDSKDMAYDLGYVTTVCGRKRRLPDIQLDEYEFEWKNGIAPFTEDLLDFDRDTQLMTEVPEAIKDRYYKKLKAVDYSRDEWDTKSSKRNAIYNEAQQEGIIIINNGGKIADAERQCVNARIQGSAADLTKLAMIKLNNNKRLKELGFRLLVPVHDEVIAECPEENIKECSELLAKVMSQAAESILEMPIKCDVEITKEWYGESVEL